MKRILGLDLGTNSIGWALIEIDHKLKTVKIIGLGSRILPMDAGEISKFENGSKLESSAAQRTEKRGSRRLIERFRLRRDRLHLVLDLLKALPEHYSIELNIKNEKGEKSGQFKENKEPKLAYLPKKAGKKAEFIFKDSYNKMLVEIDNENVSNKKGSRVPYDWTLYYLRQKALSEKIDLDELAWVLLSYNQKRGYEKTDSSDEFEDLKTKLEEFRLTKSLQENIDTSKLEIESLALKVENITQEKNEYGNYYKINLENGYSYKEYSNEPITELTEDIDEIKLIERLTFLNEEGNDIDNDKTIYKVEDNFKLIVKDIVAKEAKGKFLKKYANGWTVDTNENDFIKFRKTKENIEEEVFITRHYNENGDLIKPLKDENSIKLAISKNVFSDFKLLDSTKASNWKLLKKKTEKEALKFNSENGLKSENGNVKKYISPKIYNVLKNDAINGEKTKIIGGMFQVVDRGFYREELNQIIKTQKKFHPKLEDINIINDCVEKLYPNNNKYAGTLKNTKAIKKLLIDDILLYNRPLKSKKSEIANCKYEIRYWKNLKDKNGKYLEEVDEETGEIKIKKQPIYRKVVSASHPYFQEFRIWDKIHSLKLIQLERTDEKTEKKLTNQDVTKIYIKSENDYKKIFNKFNNQKSLNEAQFLKFCKEELKVPYDKKNKNFVWNFPFDEELKGNETKVSFITRFKRCGFIEYNNFLTIEKEVELWHYLYSVNYKERKANNYKSLATFFSNFFRGFRIDKIVKDKLIKDFANYPSFTSKYCAYSEKSLKKMLPILRLSQKEKPDTWESENWYIDWLSNLENRKKEIVQKLNKIDFEFNPIDYNNQIKTEVDAQIGELPFPKGLFNSFKSIENIEDFSKLNLTQTSYLIYGRHSELADAKQWKSPDQIRKELHQELKQHSLNNPVAEKVLLEMMQVVADIWENYGNSEENYFSKIHLEVARELKKSNKEKENISKNQKDNRTQNKRLRQILEEFLNKNDFNVKLGNKDHFERLKIVEEGAEHRKNIDKNFFQNDELKNKNITKKDIEDILKKEQITKSDFDKYKLWIEQGYLSPYSGNIIKLTDLFNGNKYNIDHIFPQAMITNNSLSNKVVVEVELNQLKSDRTARNFIQEQKGKSYSGHTVLKEDEFVNIVKKQFSGTKRYILLSKDIPKGFTNSQLNNSKYIARKAMELLSHIVREKGEVEFRSKHVLPVTGVITSELKRAWKLNQVWSELVSPRFLRMNELTQSNLFGSWQISKSGHKYFDCNLHKDLREKDSSYDIKRIDHRHHALDALIVAMCTEEHVNYINNINANSKLKDFGKQKQLEEYRKTLKKKIKWSRKNKEKPQDKDWFYMKPGEERKSGSENSLKDSVVEMTYHYQNLDSFDNDYKSMILIALQNTLPSFKQPKSNIRKATNKYMSYYDENGKKKDKKSLTNQIDVFSKEFMSSNKRNIAIRKKMHDENPYGKGKVFYEWCDILKNLKKRDLIVNESIKLKLADAYALFDDDKSVIQYLKSHPLKDSDENTIVETIFKLKTPKDVNTTRIYLTDIKDEKKLKKIIDFNVQRELLNHVKTYDTIKVPLLEAKLIKNKAIEYESLKQICKDEDQFSDVDELFLFLENNEFKLKSKTYKELTFYLKDVKDDLDINNYKLQQNYKVAFSPENIEIFNKKRKIPIKKVKEFQKLGKYQLGTKIGNRHKMVKGANSLFIIDRNADNQFATVKLRDEIKKYYEGEKLDDIDTKNKFSLKVGDLVYYPSEDEIKNYKHINIKNLNVNQIYKFVNSSEGTVNFIPFRISNVIFDYSEKSNEETKLMKSLEQFSENKLKMLSSKKGFTYIKNEIGLTSRQNKNPNDLKTGNSIKDRCWKLKTNRLGDIVKIIND